MDLFHSRGFRGKDAMSMEAIGGSVQVQADRKKSFSVGDLHHESFFSVVDIETWNSTRSDLPFILCCGASVSCRPGVFSNARCHSLNVANESQLPEIRTVSPAISTS